MTAKVFTHATWRAAYGIHAGDLWINEQGYIASQLGLGRQSSLREIDASQWILYPGLINAHDHLEFNHYPRTRWRERYENASQWAADMQPHLAEEPFLSLRQLPLDQRCWVGGLKNLLSGVTTVAHHNPFHPPLKDKNFPVEVYQPYGWAHSLYLTPSWRIWKDYHLTRQGKFMLHLAEGTDEAANAELKWLDRLGCLGPKTVLIHGVGLKGKMLQKAIQKSGGLVWCPSSNEFLLGQTSQVEGWYAAGKLALGSDSLLTADGNLLDELRAARRTGQLTDEQLVHLVTDYAANLLRRQDIGDLKPGMRADVIALKKPEHGDVYRALLEATPQEIIFVMRAGEFVWKKDHWWNNSRYKGVACYLPKPILEYLSQNPWVAQRLEIDF